MSPTVSELADVLDREAASVLRAIDDEQGATVETVVERTGIEPETVENRCQQLSTLGLVTDVDLDGGNGYEVTGRGHGAIGSGLFDEYDMVGDLDLDALAEQVAELLDRRDDLQTRVGQLGDDAEKLRQRADRRFDDREDVAAEFESLLDDVEELAESLDA